ncbi:DUF4942 domain-containing protein (plasmid) [Dyella sp. BiH032]|uniref:DUF4942 domain-containing protein n=1 Tax=Dyella sp. BiH032 TaxID=3075430 RepID=UPI002892AB95|nr:DUF4942 domain-containing protein [Dyella sp. BiH032]WNL48537.1 DUF4942 domain-containing protein [Dyella sp. BiH032]
MTTALSLPAGPLSALLDNEASDRLFSDRGVLGGLFEAYAYTRHRIQHLAREIHRESGAVSFFLKAYDFSHGRPDVDRLFSEKKAIAALNSEYWQRTLALTDVYDCMPQSRRDEWDKAIRTNTTPDYNLDAVRPTIASLLSSRAQFFAERVDGIFRTLSRTHVTNLRSGFNTRMIVAGVIDDYGFLNTTKAGYINDLRKVIAKFMGRDEPRHDASNCVLKLCQEVPGKWHPIDGGALRIRVYKVGTAHIEVHPDMAWRLNAVLAHLYPQAIPRGQRTAPKKPSKKYDLIQTPLPFAVLRLLDGCKGKTGDGHELTLPYLECKESKASAQQLREVLEALGGVYVNDWTARFDYDASEAIKHVLLTGCLPERQSHQFYPTPRLIAKELVRRAELDDTCSCLEPSAGQGGIADLLPKDRTVCVEVSGLHCAVLKGKGFAVVNADFLAWSAGRGPTFSRVLMNPPFSEGRARDHVLAAAGLVKPGGRLCAVVPASLRGVDLLPGWASEWSQVYQGEFQGTGAAVVIYVATRRSEADGDNR